MIKLLIFIKMALMAIIIIGWSMNVYKLTEVDFKAPYKEEIIRGASVIVFPMGAVVGFVDIKEEN